MKIEEGVPIPPPKQGELRRVAMRMRDGDSILCPTLDRARSLASAMRSLGAKPVRRKQADGWRVWRVQ